MDDLQYYNIDDRYIARIAGFKPCYKWMTFNTEDGNFYHQDCLCFKPCYKWMTFNTGPTKV